MSDYRTTPKEVIAKLEKQREEQAKVNKIAEEEKAKKEADDYAIAKEKLDKWKEKVEKIDQEIAMRKDTVKQYIADELIANGQSNDGGLREFETVLPIGLNVVELWYDQEDKAGISISVNGHYEHYFVASDSFKNIIYSHSLKSNNKPLRKSQYNEIVDTVTSICKCYGKFSFSYLRIAVIAGKTYIDLVNDKWEAVEIDEFDWRVVNSKNVKFIRNKDMLPQCMPEKGGNIEELKQFINLEKQEDFILLVGFILKCLDPHSPYPVLSLIGEQGSGKTETSQMIIDLVAPSIVPMRSMPSNERNFLLAAKNNYIFAIDNLSDITNNQSDWICRLATGSGFSSRALFTNSEESTMFLSRPLIINGINALVDRPDLVDRSIILTLPQITEEVRRSNRILKEKFIANKPRILGALLNGLSSAIRYRSIVEIVKKPRLADFAEFMTAAEVAFGWEYETFLRAYKENISESGDESIAANPLALAIITRMRPNKLCECTAIDFIAELRYRCFKEPYLHYLPMHPNKFSKELMRIKPLLRKHGIFIERVKTNGKRLIRMSNTPIPFGYSDDRDDKI